MGLQRTASLMLISAAVSAAGTSAFWLWRGTEWVSPRVLRTLNSPAAKAREPIQRAVGAALAIPVAGVRPEELVDTFTQARAEGFRRHDAIDIIAPAGTPVVAAAAGTLEKLFISEEGGLTIYIRSPDRRIVTYYAHLRDYAPGLREGQPIRVGEPLGSVGSTGNANPDGPHLHFSIERVAPDGPWSGGEPLNPYPLLTGRR